MITEKDIQEQIAKYQGKKDIKVQECVELSAFYILKNALFPDKTDVLPQYSFATAPEQPLYDSGSEFSDYIKGVDINDVLSVMDELMEATFVYNKALYNATLRKLKEQG